MTGDGGTSLLRNRRFLALFAAQIASLLGSGVTSVGLALLAHDIAGGEATAIIGTALMLRILAFLVFSQPAGVIADRVSRKRVLVSADLVRVGLLAFFPFVDSVWQIYALIFAINAVTAFFTPTYEASLPEVVGPERYVKAVSLSRVAVDAEAVAGPVVAGLLVASLGLKWVFWFDAATYLVSALLIAGVAVPRGAAAKARLSARAFASELTYGTRLLLSEPSLRQALLLSGAEATAGAAAIVATVVYVQDLLGRSEGSFAAAMAVLGAGSAATALALGRLTLRFERGAREGEALHGRRHAWARVALVAGGLVLAVALLPGVLLPPFGLFAALWFVNGVGQALVAIPSSVLLAEHTREDERGRAYAAHFALTHAFWLVSYPAVGFAAVRWGAPVTFTAAGVFCLLITAAAALAGRGVARPHLHERTDPAR